MPKTSVIIFPQEELRLTQVNSEDVSNNHCSGGTKTDTNECRRRSIIILSQDELTQTQTYAEYVNNNHVQEELRLKQTSAEDARTDI